jgi:alpha-glucosidase
MPEGWDQYAVDVQLGSAASMLGHYRRAIAIRRQLAPRLADRMGWCPSPDDVLLYERGRLVVACNFSSRTVKLEVGGRLLISSDPMVRRRGRQLSLPPNSAAWLDVLPS